MVQRLTIEIFGNYEESKDTGILRFFKIFKASECVNHEIYIHSTDPDNSGFHTLRGNSMMVLKDIFLQDHVSALSFNIKIKNDDHHVMVTFNDDRIDTWIGGGIKLCVNGNVDTNYYVDHFLDKINDTFFSTYRWHLEVEL